MTAMVKLPATVRDCTSQLNRMSQEVHGDNWPADVRTLQIDMRSMSSPGLKFFDQSFLVPHFALGLRQYFLHPWLAGLVGLPIRYYTPLDLS